MHDAIAERMENLEAVLNQIPKEHRGIGFERVLEEFNAQENTRRLELALALLWAERNSDSGNLLLNLLHTAAIEGREPDPREEFLPQNEHEKKVAFLATATVIQWLGTSGGCAFLREAFRKSGGNITYELPNISGYEESRR